MSKYYDYNGIEITKEQIEAAFTAGEATLIHSNGDGKTVTALSLKHKDHDSRNACFSAIDEVWTQKPALMRDCLSAAKARFNA